MPADTTTSTILNRETGEDHTFQLLLQCSRVNLDPSTKERIDNLLQREIDWDRLIESAYRNGVMPLLYKSLNNNDLVPKNIIYELKSGFFGNIARNFLLVKEPCTSSS